MPPTALPDPDRRPDAILFPEGKFQGLLAGRLAQAKAAFAPALGSTLVSVSRVPGKPFSFATPAEPGRLGHGGRSLLYPKDDARRGQERYDWFVAVADADAPGGLGPGAPCRGWEDRPEKVRLGYLRDLPDPEAVARAAGPLGGLDPSALGDPDDEADAAPGPEPRARARRGRRAHAEKAAPEPAPATGPDPAD